MAIDLTGISNENEFYTHHYLAAILESDIKPVLARWREAAADGGPKAPFDLLGGLARTFFRFRDGFDRSRDLGERRDRVRGWLAELLAVVGYPVAPMVRRVEGATPLPVLAEVARPDGAPLLWVLEALARPPAAGGDDAEADPLNLTIAAEQYPEDEEPVFATLGDSLDEIVTAAVFGMAEPPRWVIVAGHQQLILIDRSKWAEKRLLRFDLAEVLGRKDPSTLQTTAVLLHRDSLCPADGPVLADTLDQNAHKHAFEVSEDLKYALREAIELLGNEAIRDLRERQHVKVYDTRLADRLTLECLRYMYRLLFLFYIEARPELGYAPINAEAYRKGYSLESLRALEMVRLTTDEDRNGTYINESLRLLFELIDRGYPFRDAADAGRQGEMYADTAPTYETFAIAPLKCHLFDPERTPLLRAVRFRNEVLQKVIALMSLTRPKPGKGRVKRRGRVSYATLGINQLGAVYEALLSYRGFFAEADLYEVKKAKDQKVDELSIAYFVKAEELDQYQADEKVFNQDGTLRCYPKGSFIYRLAGRDRQKSASYYTPEALTRCLVKYALKELLKDKTADEILALTVCEPAMGSAAFLNEAVNQLAEAYLERKQQETGQRIGHDAYATERQRVRMYLADRNVFGVDLNPVAVELAEVSLWLNCLHETPFVPWFGMQLVCGNSLVGARRQVYRADRLGGVGGGRKGKGAKAPLWHAEAPERVMPGTARPVGAIYHFLLPDPGMAKYTDKVVKALVPDAVKAIDAWRRAFVKPFTAAEVKRVQDLSAAIDRLWEAHTKQLRELRARTTDAFTVWPAPKPDDGGTDMRTKDRAFEQELLSREVRATSPYRRLKLVMDYWCALWFWPIEAHGLLPSRSDFLTELGLILESRILDVQPEQGILSALFAETMPEQLWLSLEQLGQVNVDGLVAKLPRLGQVQAIAERQRFLHWELEFADIFADRGGFDLILGNPPWIRLCWDEDSFIGDLFPYLQIRTKKGTTLEASRKAVFADSSFRRMYFQAYEGAEILKNVLSSNQLYTDLNTIRTNTYKNFLVLAWSLVCKTGVSALIHPDGIFEDPDAKLLRRRVYRRLKYHFQFQNQMMLFPIGHREKFSLNVYVDEGGVDFVMISNLFNPTTIDDSINHSGTSEIPAIKDDENNWNVKGHSSRLVRITNEELVAFAHIFDGDAVTPEYARLPAVHATESLRPLRHLARHNLRILDITQGYISTTLWPETKSRENGAIIHKPSFAPNLNRVILSGPNFSHSCAYFKSARQNAQGKADYDVVDLEIIPDNYIPRTVYQLSDTFSNRDVGPSARWMEVPQHITEEYRLICRSMIGSAGERSLIPAIIPNGIGHIELGFAIAPRDRRSLPVLSGIFSSLIYDFLVKSSGKQHFMDDLARGLPFPIIKKEFAAAISVRMLGLNCLTSAYSELWADCFLDVYCDDTWSKIDHRLDSGYFRQLTPQWSTTTLMRLPFIRRQALVEVDILVAISLGIGLHDLVRLYNALFPVLRWNERNTYYDQFGRITYTANRNLPGVGVDRKTFETELKGTDKRYEREIEDDTLPGGPHKRTIVYQGPFDRCDRERDYEIAWAAFTERYGHLLTDTSAKATEAA